MGWFWICLVRHKLGSSYDGGLLENVLLSLGDGQSALDRTFEQNNGAIHIPNQPTILQYIA